jgi:hypothetical protein
VSIPIGRAAHNTDVTDVKPPYGAVSFVPITFGKQYVFVKEYMVWIAGNMVCVGRCPWVI